MPADRLHLIRHGEVHNPNSTLYGRLPHFALSERGRRMAQAAADELKSQKRNVVAIYVSPLLRTRESAEPVEAAFGLPAKVDDRLVEPWNVFEGRPLGFKHVLVRPHLYRHVRNPWRPSWGEPYVEIADRMFEILDEAWRSVPDGDVVLVSHQLPIEVVRRSIAKQSLPHNPRSRLTRLSSITSLERRGNDFAEVDFKDPGAAILAADQSGK